MPSDIINAGNFRLVIHRGWKWVDLLVYEQDDDGWDLIDQWEHIPKQVFSLRYAKDFLAKYEPLAVLLADSLTIEAAP